jgi:UDP-2-acetamido-2-deoxy-ribo-hexuluronate aminotransferase
MLHLPKMIDLEKLHQQMQPELQQAIHQVILQSDFINGRAVDSFLAALKAYSGAANIIGCGNGTDALQLALMALDLKAGAEVILPAFNYVSAAEAVALLGLKPVFADVCPDTFNLDPASVADKLTAKTAAVIPVHLFGQCAPMDRLMPLAQENNLYVIEDNAQSLGATWQGPDNYLAFGGNSGHLGTTSFFPSKMLGGMGDGGAVFTGDAALAGRIKQLARHGQQEKYRFDRIGINSRLDGLQAAVLEVKLRYLDQHISARQAIAGWYHQVLMEVPQVALPRTAAGNTHVYNQYTIRVVSKEREALQRYLLGQGIPTAVYYPMPLHMQPAYRYLGCQSGDFPVAELLCGQVLSLPIHPLLSYEEVCLIGEKIRQFFQ